MTESWLIHTMGGGILSSITRYQPKNLPMPELVNRFIHYYVYYNNIVII